MQDQFRLYPRGFLGSFSNKPVVHRYDASAETLRILRNTETSPPSFKMLGAPNQDLDVLYQSLLNAPSNMERFVWREELLKVALKAFGTESVKEWVNAQAATPYCGKYHKDFISDCMRFANGNPRYQAISTWNNLLSDEDMGGGGKLPTNADGFYFNYVQFDKATIVDLVKAWCSQEGGYSDMVISLNILFGRYDGLY